MANWVCKQDGVQFTPGAPCCPQCQTRDAFELGGDRALNLYDAVEVTGIASPGAAWATVNEAAAVAVHEHRQAWQNVVSVPEAVAVLMSGDSDAQVAERLGLVPGDSGAADSSTDPEPVYRPDADGVVEFPADGVERTADLGGESDDAVSVEDTPDTSKPKSTSKAGQNDVPS